MYSRHLTLPKSSFFLFGIRGSGKSTWLKQNLKDAKIFNLLDEALYQQLLVRPQEFRDQLRTLKKNSWVVVDEVQRLPPLLNEVQRGIEDLKLNFALTGSSARKLNRAGVNLLAGRARLRSMLPLLPTELQADFNIEKILRWGSVPLIWNAIDKEETLQDYVQTYIKQEIQAEALVRNLAGFARSLPVTALYNGQTLNISNIARDAEIERKTAEGYIHILEDTLLVKRLYPYETRLRVREKRKAKLYWVDTGIVRAAKGHRGHLTQEEKGPLLESYIFQCIRHEIENTRQFQNVYYWSPAEAKMEVDFLIENEKGFIALEVKASNKIRPEHLNGLKAIKELKGIKKRIVVYLGEDRKKTEDGIEILPVLDFAHLLNHGFK